MTYENHKYLLMNSRLRPFPCYWYCNDILWWCNQLLITAILVLLMSCLLLMISQSNCTCIYWIISLVAFINGNFIGVIRSEIERVIFFCIPTLYVASLIFLVFQMIWFLYKVFPQCTESATSLCVYIDMSIIYGMICLFRCCDKLIS